MVGNLNVQSLPHLEHGLEAVLESKGLYPLKFEGKFLFSSFLQKIHQPLEINYERLPPFIPPSRDTVKEC